MSPRKSSSQSKTRAVSTMAKKLSRAYKQFKFPASQHTPSKVARFATLSKDIIAPPDVSSFDWRERITINSPGNQNNCNACTSFAITSAIEANWLIANHGNPIAVSPGYIHTCLGHEGEADVDEICVSGIDLFAALNLVKRKGYALLKPGDYPFPIASCTTTNVFGHITNFAEIDGGNEAKTQILRGPIVADMYIWEDFFDYTINRAPAYVPDTTKPGPYLHSVCVIGFNSNGWIIKNSFGPDWGDGQGFATIAYNACGLIDAPPPPGGYYRQTYAIKC